MNNFETFKEVSEVEALKYAIENIPYYEVTDNISHLPNKDTFKMKLLNLLAQEGKVLVNNAPDKDVFESVYTLWHEEMVKEFNPENQDNRYGAAEHQLHIDPRESEREAA